MQSKQWDSRLLNKQFGALLCGVKNVMLFRLKATFMTGRAKRINFLDPNSGAVAY